MLRWHEHLALERKRFNLQLSRTLTVSLVLVFILVLLWIRVIAPSPVPEPVIDLPRSSFAVNAPEVECQQTVSIRGDGSVFSFGEKVSWERIRESLNRRESYICNNAPMRLRIDTSAPFGAVRAVLRSAQRLGWSTFVIVVLPLPRMAPTHSDIFSVDMSPDVSGA